MAEREQEIMQKQPEAADVRKLAAAGNIYIASRDVNPLIDPHDAMKNLLTEVSKPGGIDMLLELQKKG